MARDDISHYEGLTIWGPLSCERVRALVSSTRVPAGARALDIACGRGELLLQLAEVHGCDAVGVDRSRAALDLAEAAFAARAPQAARRWVAREAADFTAEPASFDVVSWLGGPYLGAGFRSTVERLSRWLRPRGHLVLGHGFWLQTPPQAYLDATGIGAGDLDGHADNVATIRATGHVLLRCGVSSRDEWDTFEGRILENEERYALDHPGEDLRERLERKRSFHDAQQRWGRAAMGFGLYLALKPP